MKQGAPLSLRIGLFLASCDKNAYKTRSFAPFVWKLAMSSGPVITGSPIYDAEGRLTIGFITIRDITEQKRTEAQRERLMEELQRSRTLLSEAERLAHTGAWEWNLITDDWTFSEEWLRIHGVHQNTLTQEELHSIAHPEDVRPFSNP